ncbi:MAG: phospho-sugar mutase [Firmicutes bacterium]|nr:phospho-sugar mutase [Bacillota bacterium]
MENIIKQYTLWRAKALPPKLYQELEDISKDTEQIYERFCREINFGTSGLRGKMGVGPNRMNEIVIKRATMGVADYLHTRSERPLAIIGYDTRINSKEFAEEVARDLSVMGVDSYLFDEPTPVPVVSFAIRHLGASCGIMITASHNPKEYNGYKVYDSVGNQIDDDKARLVESYINKHEYFEEVIEHPDKDGVITIGDGKVKEAYLKALGENLLLWTEDQGEAESALAGLNIIYTPLNGAGRDYCTRVFENLGVSNVTFVAEQWERDGNFPTCPYPNPENPAAFNKALGYIKEDTDIIIGTDPDSDRMGVMAKKDGEFVRLTGDQVGLLMLDYICQCHTKGIGGKTLGPNKVAYKSFVSSPFAEDIAKHYGIQLKNVPTGFKNIAREMEVLKQAGREDDFLFGFEESLGYLYGTYTRDKDGVLAAQMICLIAAYLKSKGESLLDRLEDLHHMLGYVKSKGTSIEFKAEKDRETMAKIMEDLFDKKLTALLGEELDIDDEFRALNMFRASTKSGHQFIIRPSGTELKVKIYAFAKGNSEEEADKVAARMVEELTAFGDTYR